MDFTDYYKNMTIIHYWKIIHDCDNWSSELNDT